MLRIGLMIIVQSALRNVVQPKAQFIASSGSSTGIDCTLRSCTSAVEVRSIFGQFKVYDQQPQDDFSRLKVRTKLS
jgi:hypothetical protein